MGEGKTEVRLRIAEARENKSEAIRRTKARREDLALLSLPLVKLIGWHKHHNINVNLKVIYKCITSEELIEICQIFRC